MSLSLLVISSLCIKVFKVNVSEQECTVIQFVNELIQLCDGFLALSNAPPMSRCEIKQILDFVSVAWSILCLFVLFGFLFYCLFVYISCMILKIK